MATIYDIAKACDVSPSTVSKVINNYDSIPEDTKNRIIKAAMEMNYVPNLQAKSLSKGVSKNIGIMVYFEKEDLSPLTQPLFASILESFSKEVSREGYNLLFISHEDGQADSQFLNSIISRSVEGVVILGDVVNKASVQNVINSHVSAVAFDYIGDQVGGVFSDCEASILEAIEKLVELGHRRIAFIHGENSLVTKMRIDAYCKALEKVGIPFDSNLLVEGRYFDEETGQEATRKLLQGQKPTAILYPDDFTAVTGIEAIRQAGLSVPEDISVIGFDGLLLGKHCYPKLTTIAQDTVSIGKSLAKQLIEEMAQGKDWKPAKGIAVLSRLEIRDSISLAKQY